MPGNNKGGQLNLFLFELGMVTRDPLGIVPDIVTTIGVHPLVVVPTTIRYSDRSRTTIAATHDGSVVTKAGRDLRTCSFQGSFGVQSRGLLLYIGTGQLRFDRFYHEVVRLNDAVSKGQVDAEKDPFRSPLLSLWLKLYNPDRTTFFCNYYDFWHNIQFECDVTSFSWTKSHRGGGATGLTPYQCEVAECGPIVTGSLGTTLINGLFQALTTWDSINELIKSYTLDAIVGSLVDAGGIVAGQLADSINAFNAQIDGATAVINGSAPPGTSAVQSRTPALSAGGGYGTGSYGSPQTPEVVPQSDDPANGKTGLSGHLAHASAIASSGTTALELLRAQSPAAGADSVGGAVDWASVDGEGSLPGVDAADAQDGLSELINAARFQSAVGALYGMSREEYEAFLSATGLSGREPSLGATVEYVVTTYDTPSSIEQQFGVPFEAILRLNGLTPDEALLAGTVLMIPRHRVVGQPITIEGLPTFGSHTGRAAWGSDLYTDLRVDATGSLAVLSGPDVLVQGINWTISMFSEHLSRLVNETPDTVRDRLVRLQLSSILASDRRIASVDQIETVTGADGTMQVAATVTAINGAQITTGIAT